MESENLNFLEPCGNLGPVMGLLYIYSNADSFHSHYGPGVESASNRNEYQEYFLRVKAAGA